MGIKKKIADMPFVKIWLHLVWTTKNKEPYLKKKIRHDIFKHIWNYAETKGIHIDFINGHFDHVHCLLSLNAAQSIAEIMQLIKGESSFWINKNNLIEEKFAWQEEYYAASLSKVQLNSVRNYIKLQEVHHKNQLLEEEIKIMIEEYGLEKHDCSTTLRAREKKVKPRPEGRGNSSLSTKI